MRRLLVAAVVLAQVLVLVFMVAEREYIIRFGRVVFLRTAPLDPRDIFRGDFVRLDYEISSIAARDMQGALTDNLDRKGVEIYAVLKEGANGLAELDFATDAQPVEQLYIRGRLTRRHRSSSPVRPVRVKYGIEQMFVEQWKGKDIERKRGTRDALQIPMEVEVSVSRSGKAVLTGYRWSRLGVQLEIIRVPAQRRNTNEDEPDGPLSPKLKVTLQNVSDAPLALANPGDNCAFELVSVGWTDAPYEVVSKECDDVQADAAQIIELQPAESYFAEIDLSHPRWHVRNGESSGEIGSMDEFDRFRLVYRAPEPNTLAATGNGSRVWRGYMPTRAFNALGRID